MLNIKELSKNVTPSARKLREVGKHKSKKKKSSTAKNQSIRSSQAAISRKKHDENREIGPLPDIVDPDRRAQCKLDFKYHCYTYMGPTFHLKFAAIHDDAITKLLSALHNGSEFLYVMPRGTGKSALLKAIIHYGVSHGLLKLPAVFCASQSKLVEFMEAIKVWFLLPTFSEDFPEIAYPVKMLDGNNGRANGQLLKGEHTNIKWDVEMLRLPTVEGVASSGTVIQGKSMSSKDIRGLAKTMNDGSTVRPDFAAIDDPQTDEGAINPRTCIKIIRLINKTIRGMKGPGAKMGLVIAATVIDENDAIHQMLDVEKYPELRGMHVKMLPSMPENLEIWTDEYRDHYKEAFKHDPPDFTHANKFYRENHAEMTKGAVSSWPERYEPGQVDAIQYAMHSFLQDEEAFYCEYQNEPGAYISDNDIRLRVEDVLTNLNGLMRKEKPVGYDIETMAIDLNNYGLNVAHCHFRHDMTGVVSDYFQYNPPGRNYIFKEKDGLNLQIEVEYTNAIMNLITREHERHPECIFGVDGNFQTQVVHNCVETLRKLGVNVYVMRGQDYSKYRVPDNGHKRLLRPGQHCHYWIGKKGRELPFDSHWWHMKTQSAFKISNPARGSLSVWGDKSIIHRDYAMECTVDMYKSYNPDDYLNMYDYFKMPGRNDKFDSTSMCQILASLHGASFDHDDEKKPGKQRRKLGKKKKLKK